MKTMKMVWFPEMLQRLREMRASGEPLFICAEEIGVCYSTAVFKARELGLAQRLNHGRITGRVKLQRTRDQQ